MLHNNSTIIHYSNHDFMECSRKIHLYDNYNRFITNLALIKHWTMNFTGIIVGLATFLIIGIFHPIVIKAEYYFGTKCWWIFLITGIIFGSISLLVNNLIFSTILGVTAFSSFWSILELKEQRQRVNKGWFPAGPGHKK